MRRPLVTAAFETQGTQSWGGPKCLTSGGFPFGLRIARETNRTTLSKENEIMLWTIFVILLVLWLLGLVTSYTFGGFVHILLVLALVVLVVQLFSGRRAL
jgi:hypothetical protein